MKVSHRTRQETAANEPNEPEMNSFENPDKEQEVSLRHTTSIKFVQLCLTTWKNQATKYSTKGPETTALLTEVEQVETHRSIQIPATLKTQPGVLSPPVIQMKQNIDDFILAAETKHVIRSEVVETQG